ncbi:Gamma-glutamyl-gamma-aminobutyrate hydrolase [Planctomycetales bacterium 10988]|nr:Gamma-glutamyl-gamma-aminobutyrate hydrolase [Planctomycetales bacterium 10988]
MSSQNVSGSLKVEESTPSVSRHRPKILVSLDRNWIHRFGLTRLTYSRLVRRAGGYPERLHYQEANGDPVAFAKRWIPQVDGLLLSGGGDVDPRLYGSDGTGLNVNQQRDTFELTLLKEARDRGLPIFGICRGCQLLNVAYGGTLHTIRSQPTFRRFHNRLRSHAVQLAEGSRLAEVLGSTYLGFIRSVHGQAVHRLGEGLQVAARAADGIIEAIEKKNYNEATSWVMGVQWHPELMPFENQEHRLINEFIHQARLVMDKRQTIVPSIHS